MNEREEDNRLDDELRRAIDTTNPEFDAEAWKQKYAEQYQTLVARGGKNARAGAGRRVRVLVSRLAIAAVILIGVAILLTRTPERDEREPAVAARPIAPSPARMLSMMSLRTAYQQGGQEALNRQLDTALTKLGPRPSGLSALQILNDLEG